MDALAPPRPALLTDLYQLTMLGAHVQLRRHNSRAVFEYFFRKLPPHTGYAVCAGLDDLLDALERLRFTAEDLDYLRSLHLFSAEVLEYLKAFRFSGQVWAAPEGSVVFPYEPIVRVDAPLPEGQLVETLLLNTLNYQTLVATKAARVCEAAQGDPVLEFGLRRAHGPDGALSGSRAAFLGGCDATSHVEAGRRFGIPVRGTHAHAWVMSFPSELEAFRAYAQVFPENPLLLVDTYDPLRSGIPNAVTVFRELREKGWTGRAAIRLDSGDLARLSKEAHRLLSAAGFSDPLIVASNDLDEDLIADLKRQDARINCWGVGTKLITGGAVPALGGVYKLAAMEEGGALVPKMKLSGNPEKSSEPGAKTPVRFTDAGGQFAGDVLFLDAATDRTPPVGADVPSLDRQFAGFARTMPADARRAALLELAMRDGRRTAPPAPLAKLRARAKEQIAKLTPETRRLRNPETYWVGLSAKLARLKQAEMERLAAS